MFIMIVIVITVVIHIIIFNYQHNYVCIHTVMHTFSPIRCLGCPANTSQISSRILVSTCIYDPVCLPLKHFWVPITPPPFKKAFHITLDQVASARHDNCAALHNFHISSQNDDVKTFILAAIQDHGVLSPCSECLANQPF